MMLRSSYFMRIFYWDWDEEEVTNLHKEYLEDLGCEDDIEYVYYPAALYR